MNPAAFSVRNRALVNAAMILTIVVGVMAFFDIPRELTPKIGFNWAFILTPYPGANPEEVEKLVSEAADQVNMSPRELRALPGVGRKTANVVLNIAFGEPTIAVDTHIFRVANQAVERPRSTPTATAATASATCVGCGSCASMQLHACTACRTAG